MTQSHDEAASQLSAWMDGELGDAEARFLQRRLEHDAGLRATWQRMQLASQCLRGQPWQPMAPGFAEAVAAAVAAEAPARGRRPLLRWAVAASLAAVALLMAPRLLQAPEGPAAAVATMPASSADHMIASPASADLVAMRAPAPAAAPEAPAVASAEPRDAQPLVATASRSERASPLPLSTQAPSSPSDFPLVDNGEERRWPRSELVGGSSDPSIEAYLVRHNQMLANEGLGGFVPYVDVVSNNPAAATAAPAPAASEGGAGPAENGKE